MFVMNKSIKKFFMKDEELKKAIESGKDVFSTAAARFFNTTYEECLEYKNDKPYSIGKYRRAVAKKILCAMYFSTKKKWHTAAFEMIDYFDFNGYSLEVKK